MGCSGGEQNEEGAQSALRASRAPTGSATRTHCACSAHTLTPTAALLSPLDTQFYLLPQGVAPGEGGPVYFQGQLEDASAPAAATAAAAAAASRGGGAAAADRDTECVAIYDAAAGRWTLEAVNYRLSMRMRRGRPPGSQFLAGVAEAPPPPQQQQQQQEEGAVAALPPAAFDDELAAALFGDNADGGDDDGGGAGGAPRQQHRQPQQQEQQEQQPQQQQPRPRRGATVDFDDDEDADGALQCSDDDHDGSDGVGFEII